MGVEANVPPTGQSMRMPTGNVWVSPQRDLIYSLPAYIKMALDLFSKENTTDQALIEYRSLMETRQEDANEHMTKVAECLVSYISNCKDHEDKDINQVLSESEYYECDFSTRMLFEHLLFRVIISAYYYGIKEANVNENQNFIYMKPEELNDYVRQSK